GMGQRRSRRAALPRPHDAGASSDPILKNEDITATAETQEETRLPDVPGQQGEKRLDASRILTMGPNEPAEEGASAPPGIDPQSKRRRSRRRAWRGGLADQTVVQNFEDARAYRAFERTLVGSIDPRSVIELALVHRLASLLWRLRRACAIETGLFEMEGARRQDPPPGPPQPGALHTTRPQR